MLRRTIVPALVSAGAVFLSIPAGAQSPAADENAGQIVMKRIHDDLTAQGYKDVTVVPSAFIVSGTNREGKPVMMLIGPNSMTMLTPSDPGDASQPPQQAQQKDRNQQIWE